MEGSGGVGLKASGEKENEVVAEDLDIEESIL